MKYDHAGPVAAFIYFSSVGVSCSRQIKCTGTPDLTANPDPPLYVFLMKLILTLGFVYFGNRHK